MQTLIKAAREGNFQKIEEILKTLSSQHSASKVKEILNEQANDDQYQAPAISYAAGGGCHNIVQALLHYGADSNQQDRYGNTPLMYAVLHDQMPSVRFLLSYGALPSQLNKHTTPKSAITLAANKPPLFTLLKQAEATQHIARLKLIDEPIKGIDQKHDLTGQDNARHELITIYMNQTPPDEKMAEIFFNKIENKQRFLSWSYYFKARQAQNGESALKKKADHVEAIFHFSHAAQLNLSFAKQQLFKYVDSPKETFTKNLAQISLCMMSKDEKSSTPAFDGPWRDYFNGWNAYHGYRSYSTPDYLEALALFEKASCQGLLLAYIPFVSILEELKLPHSHQTALRYMLKAGEKASESQAPDASFVLKHVAHFLEKNTLQFESVKSQRKTQPVHLVPSEKFIFLKNAISVQKKSKDPVIKTSLANNLYQYAQLHQDSDSITAYHYFKEAATENHLPSILEVAKYLYFGLHDGSHIPAVSDAISAIKTAISALFQSRQFQLLENQLAKLKNLWRVVIDSEQAALEEYISTSRAHCFNEKKITDEYMQVSTQLDALIAKSHHNDYQALEALEDMMQANDHFHLKYTENQSRVRDKAALAVADFYAVSGNDFSCHRDIYYKKYSSTQEVANVIYKLLSQHGNVEAMLKYSKRLSEPNNPDSLGIVKAMYWIFKLLVVTGELYSRKKNIILRLSEESARMVSCAEKESEPLAIPVRDVALFFLSVLDKISELIRAGIQQPSGMIFHTLHLLQGEQHSVNNYSVLSQILHLTIAQEEGAEIKAEFPMQAKVHPAPSAPPLAIEVEGIESEPGVPALAPDVSAVKAAVKEELLPDPELVLPKDWQPAANTSSIVAMSSVVNVPGTVFWSRPQNDTCENSKKESKPCLV